FRRSRCWSAGTSNSSRTGAGGTVRAGTWVPALSHGEVSSARSKARSTAREPGRSPLFPPGPDSSRFGIECRHQLLSDQLRQRLADASPHFLAQAHDRPGIALPRARTRGARAGTGSLAPEIEADRRHTKALLHFGAG